MLRGGALWHAPCDSERAMKTRNRQRRLGFFPTLALVLAAYLSASPLEWRESQRDLASIVSPLVAMYPNAGQNLMAPFGWSAMNVLGRSLVDRSAHFADIYGHVSEIEYGHDVM